MAKPKVRKNGQEITESNPRGAGRPKGQRDYRALRRMSLDAQLQVIKEHWGRLPLEHMLEILNDEEEPDERRDWAAAQAVSFIHPRLSSVDLRQVEPPPRYTVDLSKLGERELIELRRIMAKAQVPLIEQRPTEPTGVETVEAREEGPGFLARRVRRPG